MAKIFTFHNGTNGNDWFSSQAPYTQAQIDSIQDPNGASAQKPITSIPSPFARIALVKAAYKHVGASTQSIIGNTIYHRLVSESLDVAQIFFEKLKLGNCKIISWDPKISIQNLLGSDSQGHNQLGQTLQLFLSQDKGFNFGNIQQLFFVDFGNAMKSEIVGGTSPATLFFGPANDMSHLAIQFGPHKAFDPNHYAQLHERSDEFIEWMYLIRRNIPNFANLFPEVDSYLKNSMNLLSDSAKHVVNNALTSNNWINAEFYKDIYVNSGVPVEILGNSLKEVVPQPFVSGFQMDILRNLKGSNTPLALPQETDTRNIKYITSNWVSTNKVPVPTLAINQRTLPYDGRSYPYVCMNDFLEEYLVQTIFPINDKTFYTGKFSTLSKVEGYIQRGYLLPLKKEFYDYFTVNDLMKNDMLSIQEVGSDGVLRYVIVQLTIPVQNGQSIKYERKYNIVAANTKLPQVAPGANDGYVVEKRFTTYLYPNHRLQGGSNFYRIGLYNYRMDVTPTCLDLYDSTQMRKVQTGSRIRSNSQQDSFKSFYYITEDVNNNNDFDLMHIDFSDNIKACLIPKFIDQVSGNDQFTFAVDFGTSNTHIEYRINGAQTTILKEDNMLSSLHEDCNDFVDSIAKARCHKLKDVLAREFLPAQIGGVYKFPQRTVVASTQIQQTQIQKALFDYNILFSYGKQVNLYDASIQTNLKWANYGSQTVSGSNHKEMIKAYLEQLMMMMRNCVIKNGGDLHTTQLRWFYPLSMDMIKRGQLDNIWTTLYQQYFGNNFQNIVSIPESVSPFYHYLNVKNATPHGNGAVTIDIGGGTTDIAVFGIDDNFKEKIKSITSFRFASNALFGDGYKSQASQTNGFIGKYTKPLYEKISDADVKAVMAQMLGLTGEEILADQQVVNRVSEDIIPFFFSLEHNADLAGKAKVSFGDMISEDSSMKLLPVIYFGAIIYHTAQFMKESGRNEPDYISFSGNGSKVIDILDPTRDKVIIESFIRDIFKKVYNKAEPHFIQIHMDPNPKEMCCKGGLHKIDKVDIDETFMVLVNEKLSRPNKNDAASTSFASYKYSHMNSEKLQSDILQEVGEYISLLSDLIIGDDYASKFSVQSKGLQDTRQILSRSGKAYLMQGLKAKLGQQENMQEDPKLEETLFFYPLIGLINELGYQLSKQTN